VHDERPRLVYWKIIGPVDDKLLGSRVKIALMERRRIDGIEELPEFRDANLDELTALGERIPCGRPRLR
jgi:hypothetical protein